MIQNKWKQHKFYHEAGSLITKFESVDNYILPLKK